MLTRIGALALLSMGLALIVGAGSQALPEGARTQARDVAAQVRTAASDVAVRARGVVGLASLARVMPEVPLRAVAAPGHARLTERSTTDLTDCSASIEYTPEPDQGSRHLVADAGLHWWGWAPEGDAPRPTILLLHGAGRTGESMVDMWRETAEAKGLVLVAPNLDAIDGWDAGIPDPRALLVALDAAAEIYPVDRTRVVLFGHSRGGMAAQTIANRYDGPWRAVAVHAGTVPPDYLVPAGAGVPIRHYLGSVDRTFPFGLAQDSARRAAEMGHPFDLIRLEGHSHWFYGTGEAIAADAWTWLAARLD
ncbi:hypothetical protein [uncultured Jannaschia sp.]|uniref:hypothetical protein n=1 Tax=uncultured Jannaschia sp. TaxID=293347 RepID=UPI002602B066|nr:hypothetical protein [uncultured Jannaschia sp.]